MPIVRSDVLSALNFFLSGKINEQKLYEWALSQVVAKDYEDATSGDPLLREVCQAIIDMSNPGQGYIPTREDMMYYVRCLVGTVSFEPLAVRLEKSRQKDHAKERAKGRAHRQTVMKRFSFTAEQYILWVRIYVVLFAACSFLINAVAVFRPELFGVEGETSLLANFLDALPHLVYTGALLLPASVMVKGWIFYLYFSIFVVGMLGYWVATVSIVISMGLHPYMLLIFAPFGGIPPAMAVWLLWQKRKELLKSL